MRYIFRKILLLVICVSMVISMAVITPARAGEAPLLRVLLRRLNITDRMDLRLEGQYLLASGTTEILFPRDTALTIELRRNRFVVFFSGTSAALGSSLTLSRRDDGAEAPALRIGDSSGVYPGDLSLTISDEKIQAVLSLDMEDYLLGVVPNEMSESFPIEALKAQAVCARTYAMRKMGREGDWDVVDTTNDQVFRAVLSSNTNAAKPPGL